MAVGNEFRRDDGVGPAVAARLRPELPPDVELTVLDGEASRVVDAWTGATLAVVVDAVRSGNRPGTIHVIDVHPDGRPLPASPGPRSSHATGIADGVALGRALDRLPGRLVAVGIEAGDEGEGPGLSAAVAAAVPAATARVLEVLAEGRPPRRATALTVRGVVQGVGFRPFVWRLARRHELSGWVRNRDAVVEIHAEGDPGRLERFMDDLSAEAPPRARVDAVEATPVASSGTVGFDIVDSSVADAHPEADVGRLVPPDSAPCATCRAEMADPSDRRFGHPFISCTDCGPRFTIIEALPYDRARTTMGDFVMCPRCEAEYTDPEDRRFHAEPIACRECGPRLELVDKDGGIRSRDPVGEVAGLIRSGGIVAIKGVGGYQLACDATDERVVAELRRRKRRPDKPLAVMVADPAAACRWARPTPDELALLADPAAPIVVVAGGDDLAPSVAPGHRRVGLLLPASPVHRLLADACGGPIVLTSGNCSDEPIATDDLDARTRLAGIAEAWLVHDRAIAARYDDSVTAVRLGAPAVLRRARGLAPAAVPLARPVLRPVLAVGADLQAAFCLAAGREAHVSAHVGDLDDERTIADWSAAVARHRGLLGIEPEVVAHDLHPDMTSTRLAEQLAAERGVAAVAVQHHHAHIAAVRAEHGISAPVLGVALDGFGLGADGTIWGGELLVVDDRGFERVGHLRQVPQPGGDAAVANPARMALVHAHQSGCLDGVLALLGLAADEPSPWLGGTSADRLLDPAALELSAMLTSSAGRLLDAVAVVCGLTVAPTHEGQPAMLLEQLGIGADPVPLPPAAVHDHDAGVVVDPRDPFRALVEARASGAPPGPLAAGFHVALADAWVTAAGMVALPRGVHDVCLGGGVWANDLLVDRVAAGLTEMGLSVHLPRAVPPGDGGIALGQAVIVGGGAAG